MKRIPIAYPVLFTVLAGLGGCGGNTLWTKPGLTADQFERDKSECIQSAPSRSQAGSITGNLYAAMLLGSEMRDCLRARGYTEASQK